LKKLVSGFRRNDKKWCFSTSYEFIKIEVDILTLFEKIKQDGGGNWNTNYGSGKVSTMNLTFGIGKLISY